MRIPGMFLRQVSTIEPYLGAGPAGDLFAPPTTVRCHKEDDRRKIRTTTGDVVTATLTVFYPPGTNVPVGSRITVGGRTTIALTVSTMDGGRLPTPDHIEVACT